jgi:hypothetical protein
MPFSRANRLYSDLFADASGKEPREKATHPAMDVPYPHLPEYCVETGVSNGQIARHMAKHDELGHLVDLDAPSPIQLSSLPVEITDSQTKLKYWLSTHSVCLIASGQRALRPYS